MISLVNGFTKGISSAPALCQVIAAWLVAIALLAAAGCRSGQVLQASRLPAALTAQRTASVHSLDLAGLSRSVSDSDVLYPGDVVRITITTGLEVEEPMGTDVRIDANGYGVVPIVGPVQLAGLRLIQAEELVRREGIQRGKYIDPSVSVALETRLTNVVQVTGAVAEPGSYEVPVSQSDFMGALMLAGGLTEDAGTIVEVRHPPGAGQNAGPGARLASYSSASAMSEPTIFRVDLQEVARQGGANLPVYDGSTLVFLKKSPQFIHVMGLVNTADQYELPDDTEVRLLDAIAMAGGLKLEIADKVHVLRRDPTGKFVVIEASIKQAKSDGVSNILVGANDIVSVEETPMTFVVGTIRDFVRFGFTSGIPGI